MEVLPQGDGIAAGLQVPLCLCAALGEFSCLGLVPGPECLSLFRADEEAVEGPAEDGLLLPALGAEGGEDGVDRPPVREVQL